MSSTLRYEIDVLSADGLKGKVWLYDDSLRIHVGKEVYVFDLEGRPIFIYYNDRLFVRGLSGEFVEKKWLSVRPHRRFLRRLRDDEEKRRIVEYTHWRLGTILNSVDEDEVTEVIDRVFDMNYWRLEVDADRFRKIYLPISILPPDQYLSLVLQPVIGCPYNKCSFCTFYRDRRFRIRSVDEFREHVAMVRDFMGRGVLIRKKVFLADANALIADTDLLYEYMDVALEYLDHDSIEGFYAFTDYFHKPKGIDELRKLRRKGLKRVYIGLESGSDDVLKILNKPGPSSKAVEYVKLFKKAGINVGVIVLIGAGGREYYDEHVQKTAEVLNMMPLDGRDIIYLSRLKVREESPYRYLSLKYGLTSLTMEEMDRQISDLTRKLRFDPPNSPVVAEYDIDEFVY